MASRNTKLFLKTNNDLQNNVQTEEIRAKQSIVPEIRVEAETPIANKNRTKNHPTDQVIGSKDK